MIKIICCEEHVRLVFSISLYFHGSISSLIGFLSCLLVELYNKLVCYSSKIHLLYKVCMDCLITGIVDH